MVLIGLYFIFSFISLRLFLVPFLFCRLLHVHSTCACKVSLECLYSLTKEPHEATVKLACLALANLSNPLVPRRDKHKRTLMASGAAGPLLKLARYGWRCGAAIGGL